MIAKLKEIAQKQGEIKEDSDMVEVVVEPDFLISFLKQIREEAALAFDFLTDITCLDGLHLPDAPKRFCMVYHLYSLSHNHRLRLLVYLDESELEVETISPLFASANWLEREVYDMFGVRFKGHPDLRRILLDESFLGYPLRKDYPVDAEQPLLPLREIDQA